MRTTILHAILFAEKKFETCAHHFKRSLEIKPDDYRSPLLLVSIFLELGRNADCETYLRLGLKRAEAAALKDPSNPDSLELGASTLAHLGHKEEAREWLGRALASDPERKMTSGYNIACTYVMIGELDTAMDWLERNAESYGDSHRIWMRSDSSLDPLRNHPRFIRMFGPADGTEES